MPYHPQKSEHFNVQYGPNIFVPYPFTLRNIEASALTSSLYVGADGGEEKLGSWPKVGRSGSKQSGMQIYVQEPHTSQESSAASRTHAHTSEGGCGVLRCITRCPWCGDVKGSTTGSVCPPSPQAGGERGHPDIRHVAGEALDQERGLGRQPVPGQEGKEVQRPPDDVQTLT